MKLFVLKGKIMVVQNGADMILESICCNKDDIS